MPEPKESLKNPREADLAQRVWRLTTTLNPSGYRMNGIHETFNKLPWANQRIILARDWITNFREEDDKGGVIAVNRELGGTDFTREEIGNVEHFYVAAMMGSLVPNNPVWFGITSSASAFWELVVGPARIGIAKRSLPMPRIWEFVKRNFEHNVNQYSGADVAGLTFGTFFTVVQMKDALMDPKEVSTQPTNPAQPTARMLGTHKVVPGDWLSKIAQHWYKDPLLWPVLFDANRETIGPNPNKLRPGMQIGIPDIAGLTQSQRSDLRNRGKNWKNF